MAKPPLARAKLDETGIEQITEMIADGYSTRQIAHQVGVSQFALMDWLRADTIRSARTDQAFLIAAEGFEADALSILDTADREIRDEDNRVISGSLVAIARERAQARWRAASVRDPRRYSDRRTSSDIQVTVKHVEQLPTSELERLVALHRDTLQLEEDGTVTGGGASESGEAGE